MECSGCKDRIVVVEEILHDGEKGRPSGTISWRGIHWWPPPGAGRMGDSVPDAVKQAYDEGARCLGANAPNAAVAMLRTVLTRIVDDKGSPAARAKSELKDKLQQMVVDGGPLSSLGDWMTHVRLYGNAGAHPDIFGNVSLAEAQEVAHLTLTLIELLYVLSATIAARQAERKPKRAN